MWSNGNDCNWFRWRLQSHIRTHWQSWNGTQQNTHRHNRTICRSHLHLWPNIPLYTNTHTISRTHNECDFHGIRAHSSEKFLSARAVGESCLARDNAHTHIYISLTLSLERNDKYIFFLGLFSRQCKFLLFVFLFIFFLFWTEFNQKCEQQIRRSRNQTVSTKQTLNDT